MSEHPWSWLLRPDDVIEVYARRSIMRYFQVASRADANGAVSELNTDHDIAAVALSDALAQRQAAWDTLAATTEMNDELERKLAAANQDAEALAGALVRSGRLNHLLQFPHVSRAAFEQEQIDALTAHRARLAGE